MLLSSSWAETLEIQPGLFFDLEVKEVSQSCGDNIPGTDCIIQCCSIENTNAKIFKCNFEAQGTYLEESSDNVFKATDMRTVIVYPYQFQRICFNFGKSTTPTWRFESRSINITPTECEEIVSLTQYSAKY